MDPGECTVSPKTPSATPGTSPVTLPTSTGVTIHITYDVRAITTYGTRRWQTRHSHSAHRGSKQRGSRQRGSRQRVAPSPCSVPHSHRAAHSACRTLSVLHPQRAALSACCTLSVLHPQRVAPSACRTLTLQRACRLVGLSACRYCIRVFTFNFALYSTLLPVLSQGVNRDTYEVTTV